MTTDNRTTDSFPFRKGAEKGVIFGVYFAAMFLSFIMSPKFPVLSLATLGLAIGLPFVVFNILLATDRSTNRAMTVTALWIEGIVMVSGGSLICAAIAMAYLKWIEPDFILRQLQMIIDTYKATSEPSLAEFAQVAQGLIDNHAVPRASSWVMSTWMFVVASGSLLSGLMAILVKAIGRGRRRRSP